MTPTKTLYQPDSQNTSRYSLPPWQRYEILIGAPAGSAPDRTLGVVIPEIEGEGLYVERSDWPVLLAPVVGQAPLAEALVVARDGLTFDSAFKGLYLAHPPLVLSLPTNKMVLSVIAFKVKGAVNNELASPITRNALQWRAVTDTALLKALNIYVPQGIRELTGLRIVVAGAATVTGTQAQLVDQAGSALSVPNVQQQVGATVQTYGSTVPNSRYLTATFNASLAYFDLPFPWPMPTAAREIVLNLVGTTFGAVLSVEGRWS